MSMKGRDTSYSEERKNWGNITSAFIILLITRHMIPNSYVPKKFSVPYATERKDNGIASSTS